MDAMGSALRELFALCLVSAASEALLGGAGDGVRMVCGLSAALALGRAVARLLGA